MVPGVEIDQWGMVAFAYAGRVSDFDKFFLPNLRPLQKPRLLIGVIEDDLQQQVGLALVCGKAK
ncbi:MAG: hypothetical protein OHK0039_15010 [Bacteroidia bacterium]